MPTLSLCMIAKDEARFLDGCLESVRGLVDEIVLADTGSTDATVDIAKAHGAKIVRHTWQNDFSAARNASVEHASCEWVLVLDADERLLATQCAPLRAFLERGAADAAALPLYNASITSATPMEVYEGQGRTASPVLIPRVYRRTDDLRWEGRVHEQPRAWWKGRRSESIACPIIHYGYAKDLLEERDKQARNDVLLRAMLKDNADDIHAAVYLTESLVRSAPQDAYELGKATWEQMQRKGPRQGPLVELLGQVLVRLHCKHAAFHEASEVLDELRRRGQSSPTLHYYEGMVAELLSRAATDPARFLRQAERAYRAAMAAGAVATSCKALPGVTSWRSAQRLAVIALRLGDPRASVQHARTSINAGHDDEWLALTIAEAFVMLGDPNTGLQLAERSMGSKHPDGWVVAGLAAMAIGAPKDAIVFAKQAAARASNGWMEHHRAKRLADLANRLQVGGV